MLHFRTWTTMFTLLLLTHFDRLTMIKSSQKLIGMKQNLNNPSSFGHFCIKISKKYVQTFRTRLPETHFLAKKWTFLLFDDVSNIWNDDYHLFSIIWSFELTLFSSFSWIKITLTLKNYNSSITGLKLGVTVVSYHTFA